MRRTVRFKDGKQGARPRARATAGALLATFMLATSASATAYQDAATFRAGGMGDTSLPRWLVYFSAVPAPVMTEERGLQNFSQPADPGFRLAVAQPMNPALNRAAKSGLAPQTVPAPAEPITEMLRDPRDVETTGTASPEMPGIDLSALVPGGLTPPAPMAAVTPATGSAPVETVALPVDGLGNGGSALLAALDVPTSQDAFSPRDRKCLATAIYFEARGEPESGQYAVAQVVMNRVRSVYYPDDVCGVVYQNAHRRLACQFTFACDGIPDRVRNRAAWERADRIAAEVMKEGYYLPEVGPATHYHATYVRPRWIRDMIKLDHIGKHIFYRVRNWSVEGA